MPSTRSVIYGPGLEYLKPTPDRPIRRRGPRLAPSPREAAPYAHRRIFPERSRFYEV
jgi:hypothetical protein